MYNKNRENDSVAEWSKAIDLKSIILWMRRFKSCHCRNLFINIEIIEIIEIIENIENIEIIKSYNIVRKNSIIYKHIRI